MTQTFPNITVIVTKILCLSLLIGGILVSQQGQKNDHRFLGSCYDSTYCLILEVKLKMTF